MPKLLPERCTPDSVREFRLAAERRYLDGIALAAADRRTAAIYLWGYAAEMTLKAAYFSAVGFPLNQSITMQHFRFAQTNAARLGVPWQGNLHNLEAWASLLVSTRGQVPGLQYAIHGFGAAVIARVLTLGRLWRETLRYSKNTAYLHEVEQVREAAEWFLAHSLKL